MRPPRKILSPLLAVALTLGAGVIHASVTTQVASAAPNLECTDTLYLTDTVTGAVRPVNTFANATGPAGTVGPATYNGTPGGATTPNQNGVGPNGTYAINTNSTSIVTYRPGPNTTTTTPKSTATGVSGVAGSINPVTGLFYYGGYTNTASPLQLFVYDPVANVASAAPVVSIAVPNIPGGNGDFAFDSAGNLFLVASSGESPAGAANGVTALYRVNGPLPTSGTGAQLSATEINRTGGLAGATNGIAFGSRGLLYLGRTNSITQVNPVTGVSLNTITLTSSTGGNVNSTDLGSCSGPSSLSVASSVPGGRVAAGDQFSITATGGDYSPARPFPTGTTTGDETGLQNQEPGEVAGPELVLPTQEFTITQTASGTTDLSRYVTRYVCTDAGTGAVLASGQGNTGTFRIPTGNPAGSTLGCVFINDLPRPGITLSKTVNPTSFTAAGQTLTYRFVITNSGNVPLSGLALNDPQPGLSTPTCSPVALGATLAAGAGTTCTATYQTTNGDVAGGVDRVNTASATGQPPANQGAAPTATSSATARYAVAPLVANNDTATTPYETPVTTSVIANDTDTGSPIVPDSLRLVGPGGALVTSLTTAQGVYTANPNGSITFTPATRFVGTAPAVTYRISDQAGRTATATYTVTVAAPASPVARPDTSEGTQGAEQRVSPLANDTPGAASAPFDPASLTLLDAAGNPTASVTIDGVGTYTRDGSELVFQPVPPFTGVAPAVSYRVTDALGRTATSTYTPSVTVVARPDRTEGPQGVAQNADVLANDRQGGVELNADTLTLLAANGAPTTTVTVAGVGTYTVTDGRVVFRPVPQFTGTATTVSYQVTTTAGDVVQSTYTPVVIAVSPALQPDTTSGPQGRPQSVQPLANDAGGDPAVGLDPSTLTLLNAAGTPATTVTVPGQGVYTLAGQTITFTPERDFVGTATAVTYRVADVNGTTATSTYTPTLVAVTPTAAPQTSTGAQGATQRVSPFDDADSGDPAVDLDRGSLTLLDANGNPATAVTIAGQGTYRVDGQQLVFAPIPAFSGTVDTVRYRIANANGTTATSTYTASVGQVAQPDTSQDIQGATQTVDVLANDNNGGVQTVPATLRLINPANGQPVQTVTIADQGTWRVTNGQVEFVPVPQFTGTATVLRYQVDDTQGDTLESTLSILVTPVTPTAQPDTSTGAQGLAQRVFPVDNDDVGDDRVPFDRSTLTLLDADGNAVDRVVVTGQGVYTLDGAQIVFTPERSFVGTADAVTYRVADRNGTTTSSTYTPTVTAVTPVARPDANSGPQGLPVSVDPLDNDEPGDPRIPLQPGSLTLLDAEGNPADSVTVAGQGSYTIADGRIVFTPERGFVGTADAVTYRVADANGTTATSTYAPTLTAVTPTANPDAATGRQGSPVSVNPLANDEPGNPRVPLDPATLTLLDADGNPVDTVTIAGQGVYTLVDGRIVFTPEPRFVGPAQAVTYRLADANGTTVTSTFTPTFTAVTPVANPDTATGRQGSPVSVDPLANDEPGDPGVPLDPATLTLLGADGQPTDQPVVIAGQGTYTLENGRIVFTPLASFSGEATPVAYRVADRNGTTADSRFTPTVTAVTPVANPDTASTRQGAPVSVDPLANDTPGDPAVPLVPSTLTLIGVDQQPTNEVVIAGQGTYTLQNGRITFTPLPSFRGTSTVTYQVADQNGTTVRSTVTVTVRGVDPVAAPDTATGRQGAPVSVDPLANDTPGDPAVPLRPSTLRLLDASGQVTNDPVVIAGQGTYTISNGRIVFTPLPGFVGEATPVGYQVADANGQTARSTFTPTIVRVAPGAVDDTSSGPQGRPQSVDPLANDSAGDPNVALDRSSLTLIGPDGRPTTQVVINGQGTYRLVDGRIVFTPVPSFTGRATPVTYRVADANGTTTTARYTPTVTAVTPVARPDRSTGGAGETQSVDPLANDSAGRPDVPLDRSTLRLVDGQGRSVTELVVRGVGTYRVVDGRLEFTPVDGFTGQPDPVSYRVADANGTVATSTWQVTVTTGPVKEQADLVEVGKVGEPVTFDPTKQVSGLDPASVRVIGPEGPTTRLVVPGQGTWTVDTDTGRVTFTPEAGFTGDPTPVQWSGVTTDGVPVTGKLIVRYERPGTPPGPGNGDPGRPGQPGSPQRPGAGGMADTGANSLLIPLGLLGVALLAGGAWAVRRSRRAD